MKKKNLKLKIDALENYAAQMECEIDRLDSELRGRDSVIKRLKAEVDFHSAISDDLEQSLRACENACTYHQERSEKAFEIIGRLMVESEL